MSSVGEDCHFFLKAQCRKGNTCIFRHCAEARRNPEVCQTWMSLTCTDGTCQKRHPSKTNIPFCKFETTGCLNRNCTFRHTKPRIFPPIPDKQQQNTITIKSPTVTPPFSPPIHIINDEDINDSNIQIKDLNKSKTKSNQSKMTQDNNNNKNNNNNNNNNNIIADFIDLTMPLNNTHALHDRQNPEMIFKKPELILARTEIQITEQTAQTFKPITVRFQSAPTSTTQTATLELDDIQKLKRISPISMEAPSEAPAPIPTITRIQYSPRECTTQVAIPDESLFTNSDQVSRTNSNLKVLTSGPIFDIPKQTQPLNFNLSKLEARLSNSIANKKMKNTIKETVLKENTNQRLLKRNNNPQNITTTTTIDTTTTTPTTTTSNNNNNNNNNKQVYKNPPSPIRFIDSDKPQKTNSKITFRKSPTIPTLDTKQVIRNVTTAEPNSPVSPSPFVDPMEIQNSAKRNKNYISRKPQTLKLKSMSENEFNRTPIKFSSNSNSINEDDNDIGTTPDNCFLFEFLNENVISIEDNHPPANKRFKLNSPEMINKDLLRNESDSGQTIIGMETVLMEDVPNIGSEDSSQLLEEQKHIYSVLSDVTMNEFKTVGEIGTENCLDKMESTSQMIPITYDSKPKTKSNEQIITEMQNLTPKQKRRHSSTMLLSSESNLNESFLIEEAAKLELELAEFDSDSENEIERMLREDNMTHFDDVIQQMLADDNNNNNNNNNFDHQSFNFEMGHADQDDTDLLLEIEEVLSTETKK